MTSLLRAHLKMTTDRTPMPADGPRGRAARDFFNGNWTNAQALLSRTERIRVVPDDPDCPRGFRFEVRTPFLRKRRAFSDVELMPGPIRGRIFYHSDPLGASSEVPRVVVLLDGDQALLHPNHSRRFGILCLGHLAPEPIELTRLLPHLYAILTYENMSLAEPADPEAAAYFGNHPDPLRGLPMAEPLYGPADPTPRRREARNPGRNRKRGAR